MKKTPNPQLARAINRQAHMLAAQSFAAIRGTLEKKARAMLQGGHSLEETIGLIQAERTWQGDPTCGRL
ncbi:hypothetical protein [Polaromonas sp. AER18D-145]|uniref:hypothetical protein n=1 Tax=Polaromonas sp. AER18D-145 TaxID=1977060 RepID=UPI00114409B0|nr:hypothetical protein [Polaromonas sp. AER18D-145]